MLDMTDATICITSWVGVYVSTLHSRNKVHNPNSEPASFSQASAQRTQPVGRRKCASHNDCADWPLWAEQWVNRLVALHAQVPLIWRSHPQCKARQRLDLTSATGVSRQRPYPRDTAAGAFLAAPGDLTCGARRSPPSQLRPTQHQRPMRPSGLARSITHAGQNKLSRAMAAQEKPCVTC